MLKPACAAAAAVLVVTVLKADDAILWAGLLTPILDCCCCWWWCCGRQGESLRFSDEKTAANWASSTAIMGAMHRSTTALLNVIRPSSKTPSNPAAFHTCMNIPAVCFTGGCKDGTKVEVDGDGPPLLIADVGGIRGMGGKRRY